MSRYSIDADDHVCLLVTMRMTPQVGRVAAVGKCWGSVVETEQWLSARARMPASNPIVSRSRLVFGYRAGQLLILLNGDFVQLLITGRVAG